jgi:ABC-type antimicrobial peptide transport system permease subunit
MTKQISNRTLLSRFLILLSLVAFVFFLLCGWLFYAFYFKWLPVFEDGRYFDPESGVVFHDSSFVWGLFSVAALLISVAAWLLARKMKRRERG